MKLTIVLTPGDCAVVLAALLANGERKAANRIFDQMKDQQFHKPHARKAADTDRELYYHLSPSKQGGHSIDVPTIVKFGGFEAAEVRPSLRRLISAGLVVVSRGDHGQLLYIAVHIPHA